MKDNLGHAIANVNVFAYTTNASQSFYLSVNTDGDGQYSLSVTNGAWQVGAIGLRAQGFYDVTNQSVVVNGTDVEVDFVVQSSAGSHYRVTATVSPPDAGMVTGTGLFAEGSLVTVTATPTNLPPYVFVN